MKTKIFLFLLTTFILLTTLTEISISSDDILIRLIPYSRTNCVNTSWTPNLSDYCIDVDVNQTSNCGDKRTIKGTKLPAEWSPSVANKRYCEITTQSNNCTTRQVNGILPDIWTPDPSNTFESQMLSQTNTCGQTRQVQGTKTNRIANIYKLIPGQCCVYSNKYGWSQCNTCFYSINPLVKTFSKNTQINATYSPLASEMHESGGFLNYTDVKITCEDGQIFFVSANETCSVDIWGVKGRCFIKLNNNFTCPP